MKKERDGGGSFLNYMESLTPQDVESITKGVSPDIFEATGSDGITLFLITQK